MPKMKKIAIALGLSLFATMIAVKYVDLRNQNFIIMDEAKVAINGIVKFNGVEVGQVKKIDLRNDYKAVIEIRINRNVKVPKTARVIYKREDALLSDAWIEIESKDANGDFFANNDTIIGNSDLPENNAQKKVAEFLNKISKVNMILKSDASNQNNVKK